MSNMREMATLFRAKHGLPRSNVVDLAAEFQRIHDEAIEDAARVAEGHNAATSAIADDIRALKPHEYIQQIGGGIGQCTVCGSDDINDGRHIRALKSGGGK